MIDNEKDADIDVFEDASSNQLVDQDSEWVKLPPGDLLSIEEADRLLRWYPANLIAVVGERGGGKTTLITEIYERFMRGPFADQMFCYSQTLLGFERKSYQSRAESGGRKPDTPRTSVQEGLRFFHLGLVSAESSRRMDLLISERAGETYRDARDAPANSRALVELAKAQTIVFILDGERIANGRVRAEALGSARGMIRAFSDADAISEDANVQLVTTKFDLLSGHEAADARHALNEFEERLSKQYSERFAEFSCWHTAARDPKNQLEPAWGIPALLKSWLKPPVVSVTTPQLPELKSEFDRLLLRRFKT